jgi:hypothetical protein
MNREGFWTKKERILPANFPWLLSNSICNLLELTNAISVPEKKAEKIKLIRMTKSW